MEHAPAALCSALYSYLKPRHMKSILSNWRKEWGFNSSPEGRLILAVSAVQGFEDELNELLAANLIWDEILERAIACDLAPLLYYRLKDLRAVRLVPPSAMERLKKIYQWHAARNMNLYAKLQEVRHVFAGENIPLIPLKGAVLADLIYGNVALRPMRDLDVLVKKSDLDAGDELLRRMGYTPNEAYRPQEWFRNLHHNTPYVSTDRSLILELHHNILPPAVPVSIPPEDLWQDARAVTIMNEAALILSPEKFLLHLCVHLAYDDRFVRSLRSLADITATIEFYKGTIDWTKFITHVRGYKADRSVYYALWLACGLVHAGIPLMVLEGLAKSQDNSFLNDFILKRVTQRTVSSFENEHTIIPAWVVKNMCGDLLVSDKTRQSVASLADLFPPHYLLKKLFQTIGRRN